MSDLFVDPIRLIDDSVARARERHRRRKEELDRYQALDDLWTRAQRTCATEPLLELGKRLSEDGFLFWIELWKLDLQRSVHVYGIDRLSADGVNQVVVVSLLQHACRSAETALATMIDSLQTRAEYFDWSNALEMAWEVLKSRGRHKVYPPTPFITRPEFKAFIRGQFKGTSRSTIDRKIADGRLKLQLPTSDAARPDYARYEFADRDKQLITLQRCHKCLAQSATVATKKPRPR